MQFFYFFKLLPIHRRSNVSSFDSNQAQSFADKFDDYPIAKKLTFGFGIILSLMVVIVIVNFIAAQRIATIEHEISRVLVPVVEAELELKSDVNESLAALRGYMILGDNKFKIQRENAWIDIDNMISTIDKNLQSFDEDVNNKYNEIKALLSEFKAAQEKVEATAHSKSALPASQILLTEAEPRASKILQAVTNIINEEKTMPATPERKALLALLADSRGSFAVGLASIRAYLLSGDESWKKSFDKRWQVNEARFNSLKENSYLFNAKQKADFSIYSKVRAEFAPLPPKMFSIRGSNKWNMANYYLGKEAAPKAAKILSLLKDITVAVEGSLYEDEAKLDSQRLWMEILSFVLAIIAITIGVFLSRFITRRLSNSINIVADTIGRIDQGNLDAINVKQSKDEMGQLLSTISDLRERLQKIIEKDVQSIINSARQGDLSKRIATQDKVGCYKNLSEGINELLLINEQVIDETVDVFSSLAKGDLSTSIKSNYEGDFARIKKDANYTIEKLRQTIQVDVQNIINSAASGDLSGRISLDGKEGFFLELSEKINQLVSENQKVVSDTVRVFDAMSKGDLSQKITSSYEGEFLKLKNDANTTLEKIKNVIEIEVQDVVSAALNGDLNKEISLNGKEGFFHTLSNSINQLTKTSSEIIDDASSVVGAIAEGNLTKSISRDYQGSFGDLKNNINATINRLKDVISEIHESSELVNSGSSEISIGVNDLSVRTEQQALSLEQTARNMEKMTGSVEQSATNARDANEMTVAAENCAVAGGVAVESAVTAMKGINEASNKIAAIIGVIDEIAFQTNLLALNAAVEAARAGEQGRGFAVVAGEVRVLAQRSAGAAKEIKDLINDSVERVENGSKLVDESGETLKEIIDSVKQVNIAINSLSVATGQQSTGIQQVNTSVVDMDQMTQQNAALVEESSAACQGVSEQAQKLMGLVSFFRISESDKVNKSISVKSSPAVSKVSAPSYSAPSATKFESAVKPKASSVDTEVKQPAAKPTAAHVLKDEPVSAAPIATPAPEPKAEPHVIESDHDIGLDDDWEEF